MSAPNLTTKEQLQQYLAGAELQEVLRQTLGSILQRETLPSTEKLVGILGAELLLLEEVKPEELKSMSAFTDFIDSLDLEDFGKQSGAR